MKRLIFLFSLVLGSYASALTLSDIETQVRRNVRDTATSGNRYSDAILDDWINEAQRDVVNLTWCVRKSTSYVLSAGTTYYDLPDDFLDANFVTFLDADGITSVLKEHSWRQVYQEEPDFANSSTGKPTHYFTMWNDTGGGNLTITYLPVPDTSSTGTVKVVYAYYPADLSGDSDEPFDGETYLVPYHYALVAGVTSKIKAIEGRMDEANFYMQEFNRYVTIMSARAESRSNYRPSVQAAPR